MLNCIVLPALSSFKISQGLFHNELHVGHERSDESV
jgi:hypothetical protein